ncbi:ankyrin repeat domain-containing protein [Sinorhizobium sp. CB9]
MKLLLEYGLSAQHRNNWLVRTDGKFVENSQTVFDYQLAWALEKRMPERVRLLVEHGADVIRPVNGRTPFEWAQLGGDRELALYLVRKGAVAVRLKPEDQLHISIMNTELPIEEVVGMMRELTSPAQMQRVHPAMLHEAVADNAFEPVRRMLTLGFDVNAMTSRAPLHEAALHGHIEMAKLLIEHGADTKIRDPYHYAPPIGWAEYNGQPDMVNFLRDQSLDIFAAAAYGMMDQLTALLDADPSLMERTFGSFRPSGRADPDRDWLTPLGFAVLNGRFEVIHFLMKRGADPTIRNTSGRSLKHVAREMGDEALFSILDGHTPMT